ncbi:hypothetical protein RUND412_002282 [Rhizina undulata]
MRRWSSVLLSGRPLQAAVPTCRYLPGKPWNPITRRHFHSSLQRYAIKPFLLADIGEGIRECEVIQWFVEPEARVEQFDKLCEVQSDKASVEITSRYDGVIKKLHYEAGDMAIVGKPLVDIDIQDEDIASESPGEAPPPPPPAATAVQQKSKITEGQKPRQSAPVETGTVHAEDPAAKLVSRHASLATPAVRRLTRELNVDILQVIGSGKDGRVLKEDVVKFVELQSLQTQAPPIAAAPILGGPKISGAQEQKVPLTPVQAQMFKVMTKSLSIPHFLYSDEVHLDPLIRFRSTINSSLDSSSPVAKISYMPFIIKAVSLALDAFPLLNSRLDLDGENPQLVKRTQHNIGVAMDTPLGLLVPNVKDVKSLNILEIAAELNRLQTAGAAGKLAPADLQGGTITVSNIGNIGGTVVAPVIVTSEVAILGMGRTKVIPAFDDKGAVVAKTVINFSWSADHRVVDGATMAKMAALLRSYIEQPELIMAKLR